MSIDKERAAKIAHFNDTFRRCVRGYHVTVGVRTFSDISGLIKAVMNYEDFNEENDPWGEHDFGSLVWKGQKVFWKIDYYDDGLKVHGEPTAVNCRRVLTVMLASEY